MIIQIGDLDGVTVLEPKRYPPVARDRDREMALQAALERVQSKPGQTHSLRPATPVQRRQDSRQLRDVARRNLGRAAALVKRLQAAMTERFDHVPYVRCLSTVVNS